MGSSLGSCFVIDEENINVDRSEEDYIREEQIVYEKQSAADRYNTCKECDSFFKRIRVCKECLCYMPAKVMWNLATCPLDKWSK